ncbi:MAG: hypothetical protein EA401_00420 [Planctomycetota bacterium]|nr:MAG: hypothetical protein EA401_00420 [Planctomycetota bacterium]
MQLSTAKYLLIPLLIMLVSYAMGDEVEEAEEPPEPLPMAQLIESVTSFYPTDDAPEVDVEAVQRQLEEAHAGKFYQGRVVTRVTEGAVHFADFRILGHKALSVWNPVSVQNKGEGGPFADFSNYDTFADTILEVTVQVNGFKEFSRRGARAVVPELAIVELEVMTDEEGHPIDAFLSDRDMRFARIIRHGDLDELNEKHAGTAIRWQVLYEGIAGVDRQKREVFLSLRRANNVLLVVRDRDLANRVGRELPQHYGEGRRAEYIYLNVVGTIEGIEERNGERVALVAVDEMEIRAEPNEK